MAVTGSIKLTAMPGLRPPSISASTSAVVAIFSQVAVVEQRPSPQMTCRRRYPLAAKGSFYMGRVYAKAGGRLFFPGRRGPGKVHYRD